MTTMKRAHLLGGPERVRRAKERTERAQLLTASAREHAMELTQKYKEGNSTAREGGNEHDKPSALIGVTANLRQHRNQRPPSRP
jgi:hypothetical protein